MLFATFTYWQQQAKVSCYHSYFTPHHISLAANTHLPQLYVSDHLCCLFLVSPPSKEKKKKKLLICACFVNKSYSEITGFLGNVINKHGRKTRVINLNGNKHKQAAKQRSHSATQSPPKQPAWSVIKEGHYKCIQSPHFCQLSPFCLTI